MHAWGEHAWGSCVCPCWIAAGPPRQEPLAPPPQLRPPASRTCAMPPPGSEPGRLGEGGTDQWRWTPRGTPAHRREFPPPPPRRAGRDRGPSLGSRAPQLTATGVAFTAAVGEWRLTPRGPGGVALDAAGSGAADARSRRAAAWCSETPDMEGGSQAVLSRLGSAPGRSGR